MNRRLAFAVLVFVVHPCLTRAQEGMIPAKDGSGYFGYKHTPVLPWCGFHVHDPDRPAPKRVEVGPAPAPTAAPSDAVVLFDGKDLSQWQASTWTLADGTIEAGDGELVSKPVFGDCQIHVEWMGPEHQDGPWYNQGNNGVYLMGLYEIQIFDSYNIKIYPDGMTGAIYGQTPPRVNAGRPPGQWQSFDIVLTAPVYEGEKVVQPPRVTVLHNGVLVQNNEPIRGTTGHQTLPGTAPKRTEGPLVLSGHHCPVRFRNIWVRPL